MKKHNSAEFKLLWESQRSRSAK